MENISLKNIAELASSLIIAIIAFTAVKLTVYYGLFLHIPIFQYLEAGDLVIMAPTAIVWILYYVAINSAFFISERKLFSVPVRMFYSIFLYSLAITVYVLGIRNEPLFSNALWTPFKHWWFWLYFILYVAGRMHAKSKGEDFMSKFPLVGILLLTLYTAMFDSWMSYESMVHPITREEMSIKLTDGERFKTTEKLLFAGRTKDYWFFYNRTNGYTRALKNEDVELTDFNSVLKEVKRNN
jgi:hypothetical protein